MMVGGWVGLVYEGGWVGLVYVGVCIHPDNFLKWDP